MKIKTEHNNTFEVGKLNQDNEVYFNVEGGGEYVTSYLNIEETMQLIKFLCGQVNTYNKIKQDEKILRY